MGAALGTAASVAFEPAFEPARQDAWSQNDFRVLDPSLYASLVAQGAIDLATGANLSQLSGFNASRFDSLVYLAQRAPTHSEAQDLRRRGRITADQLRHTFAKEQIEEQYWDALAELVDDRLSAQAVALGIIRSMLPDPGFFPVKLDTTGGVVPAYPVSAIDPVTEAAASGFDEERLRVMVGSIGRPPGPNELARAVFRKLIELPDFNRGILEGDTRPEWAQTFLDVSREILTANQYAELELRGFFDTPTRRTKTAQHGMSEADSDSLVDLLGRSISVHQVTTGLARGGVYPGSYTKVPEPFKSAIQRSNIREEWAELDYANRYTYPTGFQIKAEATAGDLSETDTEQLLLELGWAPKWAAFFAKAWTAATGGAKVDPYTKKAQGQLWTALHKAYVKTGAGRNEVDGLLVSLIPDTATRDSVFALWDTERLAEALPASAA
jgi:hypothetical protein